MRASIPDVPSMSRAISSSSSDDSAEESTLTFSASALARALGFLAGVAFFFLADTSSLAELADSASSELELSDSEADGVDVEPDADTEEASELLASSLLESLL